MPDGLLLPLGIHTIPEREKIMKKTSSVKETVFVGMMGAISAVLMLLNISLPFVPGFLKFDISELPALFAGFFLGPVSGCGVIVVKILLKILFQGTDTGYVGEVMNVLGSMCFILPASLISPVGNHTPPRRQIFVCSLGHSIYLYGRNCKYFFGRKFV